MKLSWWAYLSMALLIAAAGCGRRVVLVPVEGQVMLDGQPLGGNAAIMMQPAAGPAARGRIDAEGRFRMGTFRPGDGVPPGKVAVRVASSTQPSTDSEDVPLLGSRIPEKYGDCQSSGITLDVTSGMGPVTIELSSR